MDDDLYNEKFWYLFRTYRLDGHTPVKCSFMQQVESRIKDGKDAWRVDSTTMDGAEVSTIFLGSDHDWTRQGPPLLFETIIFAGNGDIAGMQRSSTWEQAEYMHREMVEITRASGPYAWAAQLRSEDKTDD